jgi:hypothetical protein
MSHYLENQTMTLTTTLTATDVVANLKARLKMAQRDYLSFPNATRWNVQTRDAFIYQQAFYFFNAVSRSHEDKADCLIALSAECNGNWGDIICHYAFGLTVTAALREHANCP